MPKRKYTGKRWGPNGEYASRQEMQLSQAYPHLVYQPPIRINYTLEKVYLPDWKLGVDRETGLHVYIEGKELFTTDMCSKYEAVVNCNSGMFLIILTPSITYKDLRRMNAHPRIEVVVSRYELPIYWFERTKPSPSAGTSIEGGAGSHPD